MNSACQGRRNGRLASVSDTHSVYAVRESTGFCPVSIHYGMAVTTDPEIPPFENNPQAGSVPTPSPASEPPVIGASPPFIAASPPPLPPQANRKSVSVRNLLAILLSLCLGLFLADAVVSLSDDSLILFFHLHLLSLIRVPVGLFAMFIVIVIYFLMGLTPMIPKRLFLPLALFTLLSQLVPVPFVIYCFGRMQQVAWGFSLCQVILGLGILYWAGGGFKLRWPLLAEDQLALRRFSWRNLSVFLLANVFVLLPAVACYLVACAALAVDHFSEGFVSLRPAGLMVQVRKYVRNDGRTIQLFPMSHIADSAFYQKVSQSFPTNSIILMEGVTDNKNLITNKIGYKRLADFLGLAEQHEKFAPSRGRKVRADVDVDQFATNTIDLLNLVMFIHARGLNAETVPMLVQYTPPPNLEDHLIDDLLRNRNRHLLEEIHTRLSQSENIIVPWGAAHMPGLAKEIQKSGFRLDETREYVVIRFHSVKK